MNKRRRLGILGLCNAAPPAPAPWLAASVALILAACGRAGAPATSPAEPEHARAAQLPAEVHFKSLSQLTDGGDNAEPLWAFGGNLLAFQAHDGSGCNQIYTLSFDPKLGEPRQISSGKGASASARFLPGDQEIVYASSALTEEACSAPLDGDPGNAWPLSAGFDIIRANADGSNPRSLTGAQGNAAAPTYDGEASVCSKDGSIVFTSLRDGDLELYRMDASGENVQRLTTSPGYDGRAFFSRDCERIVWQASRPSGKALDEYRQLLAKGLLRPTNLEIFVARADGSDARQITYLNAQSFAPFFAPSGERVLFSSNTGDTQRKEFDIWAINVDGTELERITHAPGFDGYPMFSADGKYLAFSSSRASATGRSDTNVFVAEWNEGTPRADSESAVDRMMRDVRWLAAPEREGRGVGTPGLEAAGAYIEGQFKALGLEPAAAAGSYRQPLEVVTALQSAPSTRLTLGKQSLSNEQFQPLSSSANGEVSGKLVLAGYGIQQPELGRRDYDGVALKGNIAVIRRFVPDTPQFSEDKLRDLHSDWRNKARGARDRGAKAIIFVDAPERPQGAASDWAPADEAPFPRLVRESYGDAGLPMVIVKRAVFAPILEQLEKGRAVEAQLKVELTQTRASVFNVLARLPARAPAAQRLPGAFVVGAHYDHLGYGGSFSLAPDDNSAHVGADDNASGVATVLEVARQLSQSNDTRRDVVFVAFTAEEMGVLGSSHLMKNPPAGLEPKSIHAMLNFDMVGRMTHNTLSLLGSESAEEWSTLLPPFCEQARLDCRLSGSGYGSSDHSSFYAAGVPVLHFFTGTHSDYHKPSDIPSKVNGAGLAQVAQLTALFLREDAQAKPLAYKSVPSQDVQGDRRSWNASLGTIPDYNGPPNNGKGVLLSAVRPGSGAALAGMQRGDVLIQLGDRAIENVQDLMYVLSVSKPNQTVKAVVLREGKRLELKATFQEGRGRGGGSSPHGPAKPGASPHGEHGAHGAPAGSAAHGSPGAAHGHGAQGDGAHGHGAAGGHPHGAAPAQPQPKAPGSSPH